MIKFVEDVVLAALHEEVVHKNLARVVIDRLVLEDRMVDAGNLMDIEAPGRFLVGLVLAIVGGAFRRERLEIEAVRRVGRIAKADVGELLDEEGDPLIAIAAMGEAGMAEPAGDRLVELNALGILRPVGGDRALRSLRRDRAGAIRQQEPDQRLEDEEIGGLALAAKQGQASRFGEAHPPEKLVHGDAAESLRLMPGRRR